MQNPAESSPEDRKDLAQSSAGNVVAPDRQPPSSHSTPPNLSAPRETGGPSGPEPTRYGDWERKGRCIDF